MFGLMWLYRAFNNFGPAPMFGHFWSEIFGQKLDFSKLPNKTSPNVELERQCGKIDFLAENITPKNSKMT